MKRFRFPGDPDNTRRRRRSTEDEQSLRTVWIGDLEVWEDECYLLSYLQSILPHPLCGIKVVVDGETGLSQGFGFLDFENHQIAEEALNILRRTVRPGHTRRFKATWAASNTQKPSLVPRAVQPPDGRTVHISGLNRRLRETEIQDWLSSVGFPNVVSVKIVRKENTLESKGYAFIKFCTPIEAQAAVAALSGSVLAGYPVQLSPAASGGSLPAAVAPIAPPLVSLPLVPQTKDMGKSTLKLRARVEHVELNVFLPLCLQELF